MKFSPDTLLVSEIFESLQGEGRNVGVPAVFLRTAHCNLRCAWCDTPYTWDWERFDQKTEIREWQVDALAADLDARDKPTLIITGGEPLLQQAALANLLKSLQTFFVEVETAGTIAPAPELIEVVDQWNVSPKLAGSKNPLKKRRNDEILRAFADLPVADFKFVIANDEELDEMREISEAVGLERESVWLMPEATELPTLRERSRQLAEVCLAEGFQLSYRLHVALWGNERRR